jgi:hypothetical protein
MAKFYMKWHMNPMAIPKNPEERGKLMLLMLETVKADLISGVLTDWGLCSDASGQCSDSSEGYMLAETDENSLQATIRKWSPYVMFDIKPVMTVDQIIAEIKKVAAGAKK